MALTPKRQRFVDAYAGNGTAAARLAGFEGTDATLAATASRLLTDAKVLAALEERRKKENNPLIATRQQRQAFWTKVMQAEQEEMSARLKASELLGRSEADFTDKLAGPDGGALQVEVRVYGPEDEG